MDSSRFNCNKFRWPFNTITSQVENNFIANSITGAYNTGNHQAWIGLYQNLNSLNFVEPSGMGMGKR